MKTALCCLLIMFFFSVCAQDTIRFVNKETGVVKVIEVNPSAVKYYKFNNINGPLYTLPIEDIYTIKYSNGQIDSFTIHPFSASIIDSANNKPGADITFLIGGGVGYGYGSSSGGEQRTFANIDLAVIYKHFICSYRYTKGTEYAYEGGDGWGQFFPSIGATKNPTETTKENAMLVGWNYFSNKFLFNASTGLSWQNNIIRGNRAPNSYYYETIATKNTIGIPMEVQVIHYSRGFGYGLKLYFNINSVINTGGIMFTLKFGKTVNIKRFGSRIKNILTK